MTATKPPYSCWIITEGIAGTENQCLGVAQDLGIEPVVKRINLNQPWKSLSPYIGFETARTFTPTLLPPWPDLVISSGRKSIAASRYIKKQSHGKTIIVHIQDPRVPCPDFDLICVPEHDPMRGKNVFVTQAAPNRITQDRIEAEMQKFLFLAKLARPRIAVLIGGKSKAYDLDRPTTERLIQELFPLKGSLMLTCSRRTGEENKRLIETAFKKSTNYVWDGQGENPYLAMLGYADYILVTADSTSMMSDAATTGKPVYMLNLKGKGSRRIRAMHQNLIRHGALRELKGTLDDFSYAPLQDAKNIANEIKLRFASLLTQRDV